ncbi:hypothetical protein ACFL2Q_05415 [Thermodesulfobacteriota bacterium]
MKIFLLIEPHFRDVPLTMTRELMNRLPGTSAHALSSFPKELFDPDQVASCPGLSSLDYLPDLERKWLESPSDLARLEAYDRRFGDSRLRMLVASDREFVDGFLEPGLTPKSRIMRIVADDEMRHRYLLGMLDYFVRLFEQLKPDLVLCSTIDWIWKYAAGLVAGHQGIPCLQFSGNRIGRFSLDTDLNQTNEPQGWMFEQALKAPELLAHRLDEARRILDEIRSGTKSNPVMDSVIDWSQSISSFSFIIKQVTRIGSLIKSLRRGQTTLRSIPRWERLRYDISRVINAKRIERRRWTLQRDELPSGVFAYYPLHFQPEVALQIQAPMHTNQVAVIEALAKSLPIAAKLVVKEHIPMIGARPPSFYARIAAMPDVVLASPWTDSLKLIKRSSLTCVITGTAGLEAIFMQRPALVMGFPDYLSLGQGFVHCPNLSALPDLLPKAMQQPPVEDSRLVLYIASMLERSFPVQPPLLVEPGDSIQAGNPKMISGACDELLRVLEETKTRKA